MRTDGHDLRRFSPSVSSISSASPYAFTTSVCKSDSLSVRAQSSDGVVRGALDAIRAHMQDDGLKHPLETYFADRVGALGNSPS